MKRDTQSHEVRNPTRRPTRRVKGSISLSRSSGFRTVSFSEFNCTRGTDRLSFVGRCWVLTRRTGSSRAQIITDFKIGARAPTFFPMRYRELSAEPMMVLKYFAANSNRGIFLHSLKQHIWYQRRVKLSETPNVLPKSPSEYNCFILEWNADNVHIRISD